MGEDPKNHRKGMDPGGGPPAPEASEREHSNAGGGLKLGRTEVAVRARASEKNISLKPTNQSPYNRRKK